MCIKVIASKAYLTNLFIHCFLIYTVQSLVNLVGKYAAILTTTYQKMILLGFNCVYFSNRSSRWGMQRYCPVIFCWPWQHSVIPWNRLFCKRVNSKYPIRVSNEYEVTLSPDIKNHMYYFDVIKIHFKECKIGIIYSTNLSQNWIALVKRQALKLVTIFSDIILFIARHGP